MVGATAEVEVFYGSAVAAGAGKGRLAPTWSFAKAPTRRSPLAMLGRVVSMSAGLRANWSMITPGSARWGAWRVQNSRSLCAWGSVSFFQLAESPWRWKGSFSQRKAVCFPAGAWVGSKEGGARAPGDGGRNVAALVGIDDCVELFEAFEAEDVHEGLVEGGVLLCSREAERLVESEVETE